METIDPHQINFNKVSSLQTMLVLSGIVLTPSRVFSSKRLGSADGSIAAALSREPLTCSVLVWDSGRKRECPCGGG